MLSSALWAQTDSSSYSLPKKKNKRNEKSPKKKIIETKNKNFAHLFTPGRTHGAPFLYFVVVP